MSRPVSAVFSLETGGSSRICDATLPRTKLPTFGADSGLNNACNCADIVSFCSQDIDLTFTQTVLPKALPNLRNRQCFGGGRHPIRTCASVKTSQMQSFQHLSNNARKRQSNVTFLHSKCTQDLLVQLCSHEESTHCDVHSESDCQYVNVDKIFIIFQTFVKKRMKRAIKCTIFTIKIHAGVVGIVMQP